MQARPSSTSPNPNVEAPPGKEYVVGIEGPRPLKAQGSTPAAGAQIATLVSIAKRAVNGWACYAKRQIEHEEIARLHREIDALREPAVSAESSTGENTSEGEDTPS